MTFTVEIVGCRDDYALSRALLEALRMYLAKRTEGAKTMLNSTVSFDIP